MVVRSEGIYKDLSKSVEHAVSLTSCLSVLIPLPSRNAIEPNENFAVYSYRETLTFFFYFVPVCDSISLVISVYFDRDTKLTGSKVFQPWHQW